MITSAQLVKVIKTDLSEEQVKDITRNLDKQLTWYYNYSTAHGHSHYAVAYLDDDGIYIFPKGRALDFRQDAEDVSKYYDDHKAIDGTVFAGISSLIDVGSVYTEFVIYDTTLDSNITFDAALKASALAAIEYEREVDIPAAEHFSPEVRSILSGSASVIKEGEGGRLSKRSRTDDCNNPTRYVSGTGDFEQDRNLGSPSYLGAPIVGKTYCGRRGNDQLIDSFSERWTNSCHTTASKPVGYSISYYNDTCCTRKMGSWEHHGCRKGDRTDQVVPPKDFKIKKTKVYSWTVM